MVDTSVLVAILFHEPERERFSRALLASEPVMSAGSTIELLRVVARRTPHLLSDVRPVTATFGIAINPVDEMQVWLAEDGQRRFGIGRGAPPAVLNFGDLFPHALARRHAAPLLFKGRDFPLTDILPAAY